MPTEEELKKYQEDRAKQRIEERARELTEAQAAVANCSKALYLIAGLAIAHALLIFLEFKPPQAFGLGFNELIGAAGEDLGEGASVSIFIISVCIAANYALLGYGASQRFSWAYIGGISLYGIDLAVVAYNGAWLALLVHVIGLFVVVTGWKANTSLRAIELTRQLEKLGKAAGEKKEKEA